MDEAKGQVYGGRESSTEMVLGAIDLGALWENGLESRF